MFLVKHNGKEKYFRKRHKVGNAEGVTFTELKDEAKRYATLEEAQSELEWFKDDEYVVVEE